ncbi:MAG TPA: fatty acyl-AMP ligase [Polyangiaceae bacterium]|jgi:acyl-CoA synthetase (AMP-forming)/AMP-acid ligase II
MNHGTHGTPRTLCQAIEDAAKADATRGYRFFPETGIPGYLPPGTDPASAAEASFSYTAIERTTARFGGALQALGLRKGDRVALILPNNDDFVLCFLGAIRAGIVPVPIYPPMALGALQAYLDNTRHIVAKCGARALVTTSKIKRLLGTVQAACPALEQVVAIEGIRESTEPLKAEKITLEDVAFLQFTSGSTSRPKGVTLTHGNLAANIKCIMEDGLRMVPEDVAVSWLPLYHDMGLIGFVLAPIYHNVPVHFLPAMAFLKRPVTWLQAFTRVSGSTAYAPNFAYALCVKRIKPADLEGLDLSRWRVAGCGAEPIRPETLEAFADTFAKIGFKKEALLPSYGMAESSLAISFTELHEGMKTLSVHGPDLWATGKVRVVPEADDDAVRLVSCGKAFPLHQVQVFAADDAASASPLPEDTVGEMRIQGPSVMRGYWEDAERTREAFAGGFLKTGDLGFIHEGHVFICGRSKEVVIVNGRNYYPQDMEWEASKVPGVRKGNVVAFGAKDPSGVERDRERVIVAFEVQDAERLGHASALVGEVRKAVQEGMGLTLDDAVALPPGALPKTSSGKLQRAKTRELYETGELMGRTANRDVNKLDLVKQAAQSQLSYFKLAVLGGRKKKE